MSEREEILLIDHASLAHPLYHVSASDPDPDATSTKTVARVRGLASGRAKVAICGESTKGSFRRELDATYKANRGEKNAALYHQIDLSLEKLTDDGFPIWRAAGFEADDVVATASKRAVDAGFDVLIASADKDLLALVGPHVRVLNTATGATIDENGVVEKFGVTAAQMTDFLCLVGDASDGVRGAEKIGPKKAATLLMRFSTLDKFYEDLDEKGLLALKLTPSDAASLIEFRDRLPLVRKLIGLRYDVEIPFDDVLKERVPKDAEAFGETMADEGDEQMADDAPNEPSFLDLVESPPIAAAPAPAAPPAKVEEHIQPDGRVVQTQVASAVQKPAASPALLDEVIAATPVSWEKELEPRSMAQARTLALDMHRSKIFSKFGSAEAVLAVILAGRELGIRAMASLRAFHIIDNVPRLEATFIRALATAAPTTEYFRLVKRTDTSATFVAKRRGDPEISLTYTIEEGRVAFGDRGEKAWAASGWGKNPADLCVARASSKLARIVAPESTFGLISKEEIDGY